MACKVCSTDPAKGDRRSLVGAAVGVKAVYATLFDSIHEACPDHPASEIHKYLGSEPSFVCKGCFTMFKKYSEIKEQVDKLKKKLEVSYSAVHVSCYTCE